MSSQLVIPDLLLLPLVRSGSRLTVLSEHDHLLRRFGSLELLDVEPGETATFSLRAEADEIWAPVAGAVTVSLLDRRPQSPSYGKRPEFRLDADDPHALLIPFGVARGVVAKAPARVLRLSTHGAPHPQDWQGPAAELDLDPPSDISQ